MTDHRAQFQAQFAAGTNPPFILAHRGARAHAPENTLPAFNLALEQGADAIETDLRITRDRVIVCIHDATVDRTTDIAAKPILYCHQPSARTDLLSARSAA